MAKKTPQNKLNRDLRKAIHSGDGYDDYMTVYQFLRQKQALVTERMKIMRHRIDDFYADGGEAYQKKDGTFRVVLDGVTLSITMDDSGEVTGYEMDGIKGKQDVVRRILSLFFCLHMIPVYAKILDVTAEQIADSEVYAQSPAVQNGRLYEVDFSAIRLQGLPMIEELGKMARAAYPQAYGK